MLNTHSVLSNDHLQEELQAAVRELQQELRSTIGERAAVRSRLKQLEVNISNAYCFALCVMT